MIQAQSKDMVSIPKEQYEALLQSVEVTKEFLEGNKKTFTSADDLIDDLKNL